MIQEVNFNDFCDWFEKSSSYQNNFSYEGKMALFEYLEELEASIGEKMDFDPVAICCQYTEYENFEELQQNYSNIETIEDLQDRTTFIPIYDVYGEEMERFIIADF